SDFFKAPKLYPEYTDKEKNAVNEARKLGIATVSLIDTDCDPDLVDLPIPANDDGMRSIGIILKQLADAVVDANSKAAVAQQQAAEGHEKAEADGESNGEAPAEGEAEQAEQVAT
ncbi:MAG: 30S ribosomal protein S2, partial [Pirellulales bacterium]|nr:30S ribosomal protein S2 [Pirellulales bacterium]